MSLIETPPNESKERIAEGRTKVRRRSTSWQARAVDGVMTLVITCGAWGVVGAFALMIVYLTLTTYPLFAPATVEKKGTVSVVEPSGNAGTQPLTSETAAIVTDEYLMNILKIDANGRWSRYHLETGKLLATGDVETTDGVKSTFVRLHGGNLLVGYSDGGVRTGRVTTDISYINAEDAPEEMRKMKPGDTVVADDHVIQRTVGEQFSTVKLNVELGDVVKAKDVPDSPVMLADFHGDESAMQFLELRSPGTLLFLESLKRGVRWRTSSVEIPLPENLKSLKPLAVLVASAGKMGYVVYKNGDLLRLDLRDTASPVIAEQLNVLEQNSASFAKAGQEQAELTKVELVLGGVTLIVGDSFGNVTGWFPATIPNSTTSDRENLIRAHSFLPMPGGVTAVNTSMRDRQFVTGDDQGNVYLRHMTSDTTDAKVTTSTGGTAVAVRSVAFSPKNDEILALDSRGLLSKFALANPHPEGSMRQMFMPLHYEGYAKADHVWQSSSGTDDSEMKIGLWPLIFGTLKATFYSMLFGVPVAIMAAIYSSEFMEPRIRTVVKPLIELMASLPSVVLGFIGALVFAPLVQGSIAGVVLLVYTIPLALLLLGYLWQLLPDRTRSAAPPWTKFGILVLGALLTIVVTLGLSGIFEKIFFGGDFKQWLGGRGNPASGWLLILTPPVMIGLSYCYTKYIRERLSFLRGGTAEIRIGLFELGRFVALVILALGVSWGIGLVMSTLGYDIRSPGFNSGGLYMDFSPIGAYQQRNTLLVGLFMGFAIIPIIYTVSEDALSRVPNALRSASLGLGATRWQTTISIVLPVATSGIFAACMIGFGRAVGETMIVLMMSGRTPILEFNLFNGLSALSANIATELPEAPQGSTHYRVLFFSGLILFAITFAVNTAAEVIRVRFRKRAANM